MGASLAQQAVAWAERHRGAAPHRPQLGLSAAKVRDLCGPPTYSRPATLDDVFTLARMHEPDPEIVYDYRWTENGRHRRVLMGFVDTRLRYVDDLT
jgi:hypothetical protein